MDLDGAVRRDGGARRLLTLLSGCIAIRPARLQHLRQHLPAELADTGSEAAAWRHPAFVPEDFALLPGDSAEIERLRPAFPETGDPDQCALAGELIRAQQAEDAIRSQRMEERALHAATQGRTDPRADAFPGEVADAMDRVERANDPDHARALAAWVNPPGAAHAPGRLDPQPCLRGAMAQGQPRGR